jgi:hypothetical protein
MEIPINLEGFEGRGLRLKTASLFSFPKLVMDGHRAKGRWMRYLLRDNQGNNIQAKLRFNGLDPIPKIETGERVLQLARSLQWYEYAWMILPVILVVAGGFLGAFCGVPAVYSSTRIFRSERAPALKFFLTGVISLGAGLAFAVLAVSVHSVVRAFIY